MDVSTTLPLENAHIIVQESGKGTATDVNGIFALEPLCPGKYHIKVSHIGCESKIFFLDMQRDTSITLFLDHHSHHLEGVTVIQKGLKSLAKTNFIQSLKIEENAHRDLGGLLEQVAGVSILRTGHNISKPVVQGMYGNRLLILNNGLAQAGQQWGNDHSPEIDPLSAHTLNVVKGTAVIQYQGSSLGNIISVEPGNIPADPHLHGKAGYYFESNGRSHGIHAQQHKSSDSGFAWKLTGTLRKSGDRHTPEYFLRNTGRNEANASLQLEKKHSDHWKSNLYFSTFNTEIGILRGAHIGNLTDLQEAMGRQIPFFTEPDFSYRIESPFQSVNHHLLKLRTQYFIQDDRWIEIISGTQFNHRKEFDIRRGNQSDRPSLSLSQWAQYLELKHTREWHDETKIIAGIQSNFVHNFNNAGTGVLPLIPDYNAAENGAYITGMKKFGVIHTELGLRYDLIWQDAFPLSSTLPRTVLNYKNIFHNLNAAGAIGIKLAGGNKLSVNTGYNTRNPAINERFSQGLHQGVSGIEEGNPDLIPERAFKTSINFEGNIAKKLFFDIMAYNQHIQNYIFLNPENEFRLTIRGAFPVFRYRQTSASLRGVDAGISGELHKHINFSIKYSYLYGKDLTQNLPLVFIPPQQVQTSLKVQLGSKGKFENLQLEIISRWVDRQRHYAEGQDFMPPPPAYHISGLKFSTSINLAGYKTNLFFTAENIFDTKYRDFLNRQRYFADELGRNLIGGIQISF